jgi:hypothetical protein
MKKLKLMASILALTFAIGCSKDDTTDTPDVVEAPSNLVVTITPESKLLLKVKPTATNATSFDVYFGVTGETPKNIAVGGEATYTYAAEGNYNVKVVAKNAGTETVEKVTAVVISKLIAAPVPTVAADKVINLFSDAYTNPTVNWRTDWSVATLKDITINGNNAKEYSALDFVGIEPAAKINATTMTHFHLDVWSADFTKFKVKLVDWGADGAYAGGDDKEHEIIFDVPKKEEWVSLDILLSDFANLSTRGNIAQIILAAEPTGTAKIVIDNMYFYKGTIPAPSIPTTPTQTQANVISLFSSAYTNVAVNTWRTDWSSATFEDVTLDGNAMKKYSGLDFVGIETTGANQINATTMTHFSLAVWSSNVTEFKVKLVDWGADGAYGGGDDVEDTYTLAAPIKNAWNYLDIPLSSLTVLTTRAHISQIIFAATPIGGATVYVDNIYFHK